MAGNATWRIDQFGSKQAQLDFNAGNDWIEGGDGADLLQGDNGDPFQASTVIGHDVLIGDGNDDYDAESGDDIMFGTPGINRAEGMLGFDWVTYARSTEVVDADLANSALLPPDLDNLKDRFDLVEGVSGYEGNDRLTGTDLLAADRAWEAADAAIKLGMQVYGYDPEITVDAAWSLPSQVKKAHSVEELLKHSANQVTF